MNGNKSVYPPTLAVNVTLSAFAAERRRLLLVDNSCRRDAQQQTRRRPLLLSSDETDGRTLDRYTDSAPHTLPAASKTLTLTQSDFCGHVTVTVLTCAGVAMSERFVVEPQDAVVSRGQSYTLRCTVEGRIGEVQWLRDGFGFGPGVELDGFPRYRIQRNDQRGHCLPGDFNFKKRFFSGSYFQRLLVFFLLTRDSRTSRLILTIRFFKENCVQTVSTTLSI